MVKKRITRLNQPAWMTQDILTALKMRENAKKNKKEDNYRHWRNKTTLLIRQSKERYYSKSIETNKNNPKMLSKLFKELSNKPANSNTFASITYNSKTYTNDSDIANIFNKHFTNVADKYLSRPRKDSTHLPNMQLLT